MARDTADFFEQQEEARRATLRLVLAFAAATLFVIACFCVLVALLYAVVLRRVPVEPVLITAAITATLIAGVSLYRFLGLREGGVAVAELIGARYVDSVRATPTERRLLNVVDEMAIASGISVPPVYVLEEEGINALAAGYSPNEAVLIVTRGAMVKLTRDELQGVMAHEFSHILNGDMALNVRLMGLLAGLMCFSELGESLVRSAAADAARKPREQRGAGALLALGGMVIAFVGFPGALAADAIKAAISRQRELLADAASVQFTRNPEGLAGALDAIGALHAHTAVHAVHAAELSHMFFAPAVSRWWGFATHPPLEARIRRVHPRFERSDYRARRGGVYERDDVAVLDGQGNLVKTVKGVLETAGKPQRAHLDMAAQLLAALPAAARHDAESAASAVDLAFALALAADRAARETELATLEARRGPRAAQGVRATYARVASLPRGLALPLLDLALPRLKSLAQAERDGLLADLGAVIEADRRVAFSQFVLHTFLRQHLREGAGRAVPAQFRSLSVVGAELQVTLSLLAHASGGDAAPYAEAAAALGLADQTLLPQERLTNTRVAEALERLRGLAPLLKPRVLKAFIDCARADGRFGVAEADLVRALAATLDCPLPPALNYALLEGVPGFSRASA